MGRWQRRYGEAGVDGLLRDKTRPPGTPPHPTEMVAEVLALTCSEPPDEVTHWTGRATVLPAENEAVIVGFCRHTLLPLDDGLYGLQPTIPHLTRSRCTADVAP